MSYGYFHPYLYQYYLKQQRAEKKPEEVAKLITKISEIISRYKYDEEYDIFFDPETGDTCPKEIMKLLKETLDILSKL